MWETMRNAVEYPKQREQRKSFVEHTSVKAVMAAGMSAVRVLTPFRLSALHGVYGQNILVALSMMSLLVQVEERNRFLEEELNMAQAVEQSLSDRVSILETHSCDTDFHFRYVCASILTIFFSSDNLDFLN